MNSSHETKDCYMHNKQWLAGIYLTTIYLLALLKIIECDRRAYYINCYKYNTEETFSRYSEAKSFWKMFPCY